MANSYAKYLTVLFTLFLVTGCASRASSIAPVAVPAANYKGLSCDETRTLLTQKQASLASLISSQNSAATGDVVGVLFLLIPVGTIFGADKEGELAQAKGEVMALNGAISINCKGS